MRMLKLVGFSGIAAASVWTVLFGGPTSLCAAAAQEPIIIEASDGYGLDATYCSTVGYDCERIVADAWCEAHGRGRSVSFDSQTVNRNSDRTVAGRIKIVCK